jgi:tricorn protease
MTRPSRPVVRLGALLIASLVGPLPAAPAATAAAAADGPTRLLRQPAVGERHVVFSHSNDVWIVDRGGGEARRLTTSEGAETQPRISPDGTMVAFSGQYDGNTDVYVVGIDGGAPRRLTWHPGADTVVGWTPDGAVMFSSGRDVPPTGHPRFWTIGLEDAMPHPLPLPRAFKGAMDARGERLAYQQVQPWDIEWRNYRGGQTNPVRILDLETLELTKLPWAGSHDTDPVFLDGMVYFLSDRDFTVNIHRYNPGNGTLTQLTRHTEYDAKNLQAGGGVLVYEHAGLIRMFDPEDGSDRALDITLRGDFPWKRPQWRPVGSQIAAASLSPFGTRVLVEARGEIFSVPTKDGDWRNLTQSSGSAERAPAWSPDGRHIAWFSDAGGEYRLMIGTQDGLEPARAIDLPEPTFYYTPSWSPDGKHLVFTDEARNLWRVDVATGEATRIDGDLYAVPERSLSPVWSPDSQWIAYAKRHDNRLRSIMLHSVADGSIHRLTDGMADAYSPAFDRGGKHLYFLASTDVGLTTGWLDMSSYDTTVTASLYCVLLQDDMDSPLAPKSDEERETVEDAAAADEPPAEETGTETETDADAADEAADEPAAPSIDLDGIEQRIVALPISALGFRQLVAGPAGTVFVAESSYAIGSSGLRLHRYDLEALAPTVFIDGITGVSVSHDASKLLYVAGSTVGVVPTTGTASVGQGRVATAGLQARIDPVAEWAQIYHEAWRLHRDYFYVDNLHGADWEAVRRRYEPLLAHVSHRSDLSHLIDMVGGEIAVGHSFVGGGDTPSADSVPMGLLGVDVEAANGRYRIRRILTGERWNPGLRSPLARPGLDVETGDYILAVEGREIDDSMNWHAAFEGTANRVVRLHVSDTPSMDDARVITVRPLASDAGLRQRHWMDDNRRRVDELSGGRLAYVWLPNTGGGGYTNFNRYYFAQQDRAGAIIDERWNGGGSAADYMVDIMARERRGFFNNPIGDRTPFTNPQAGIFGPKVMIINEMAGSGGDLLPWLFRDMEIGPLVGTRTWGGLIGIWDYPSLIDGGVITVPRGGFYTEEGRWAVENEGVAPDIEVEITPRDFVDGRDPQLERAVAEALRLIEAGGVPAVVPEPAGPRRARRAR